MKKQREDEQAALDAQMEERRRRVEEWRKKRQLEQEQQVGDKVDSKPEEDQQSINDEAKAWTFEDDEDDIEEKEAVDVGMKDGEPKQLELATRTNVATPVVMEAAVLVKEEPGEDEVDPLDAFMASNEVQVIRDVEDPMVVEKAAGAMEIPSPNEPVASTSKPPPITLKPRGLISGQVKAVGSLLSKSIRTPGNVKAPRRSRKSSDESSSESELSSEEEDDAEWARLLNAGKLSKGDKLVAVDHSTISYRPFRKSFYIEASGHV